MRKFDELKKYIDKDRAFNHALTLLSWDLETEAPKKAVDGISKTTEILSELKYANYVNDEFKELLYSINEDELTEIEKKVVKKLKKDIFEKMSKIPKDEYSKYNALVSKANAVWEEAKNNDDYNLFKEILNELIIANKKFINYRGYKNCPYDVLLDDYETGLTVEKADVFFDLLKKELSPFILQVQKEKKKVLKDIKERFNKIEFSIEDQKKISKEIAEIMGLDFTKACIKESEHPFTTNMGNKDVRITTHYYLEDVLSGIYSTVHETGHAIYEQQVADEYDETFVLASGSTMGIHEAQSRFYENVIGKNKEFSNLIYDILMKYKDMSISKDEFYILVNEVKDQYIRVEADELTYPIHVMIRYEIEKKMFESIDKNIDVDDLKTMWNDMYEKYLGIRPTNDKEGILQDVHWAAGLFGYFPSYAIGSAYASQMLEALKKNVDVKKAIDDRKLDKINEFLGDTIHKYGNSSTPEELILSCCKEEFNAHYYINYLKDKFKEIYLGE